MIFRDIRMDHVAIMTAKSSLIEKIVEGRKKIETRWYLSKRAPWDKIKQGENIYFKYAGGEIIATAEVESVLQFRQNTDHNGLFTFTEQNFIDILKKYQQNIYVENFSLFADWIKNKKYAVLIFLKNPCYLEQPFQINKQGFGCSNAWLTMDNIERIKLPSDFAAQSRAKV